MATYSELEMRAVCNLAGLIRLGQWPSSCFSFKSDATYSTKRLDKEGSTLCDSSSSSSGCEATPCGTGETFPQSHLKGKYSFGLINKKRRDGNLSDQLHNVKDLISGQFSSSNTTFRENGEKIHVLSCFQGTRSQCEGCKAVFSIEKMPQSHRIKEDASLREEHGSDAQQTFHRFEDQSLKVRAGDENILLCPKCTSAFASETLLADHLKTHNEAVAREQSMNACLTGIRQQANQDMLLTSADNLQINSSGGAPASEKDCHSEKPTSTLAAEEHFPHVCSVCGKRFLLTSHLRFHLRSHINQVPSMCDKSSRLREDLTKRMEPQPAAKTRSQCPICQKFINRKSMAAHLRVQHKGEKPFKCSTCQESFHRRDVFNRHVQTHLLDEEALKCNTCDKCFRRNGDLQRHLLSHKLKLPFKCDYCTKSFRNKLDAKVHERIHTGEKPFKCSVCQESFRQSNHLQRHIRNNHLGEKLYECSTCKKKFAQKSGLTIHMRIHTEEEYFKCSVCQRTFNHLSNLKVHVRTHTKYKPYSCKECDAAFSDSRHLKLHLLTHTNEKLYFCTICNKGFTGFSTVKAHQRLHTGEKPFKCKICTKSFRQSNHLKYHERALHV